VARSKEGFFMICRAVEKGENINIIENNRKYKRAYKKEHPSILKIAIA